MDTRKDEKLHKQKVMQEYVKKMEYYNSCVDEDSEWKSWGSLMLSDTTSKGEILDKNSAVTFGEKTYPKDGWAVILTGGAGSGKGFIISNLILIDAKIADVDQLKALYNIKMSGKLDLIKHDDTADFNQSKDSNWSEEKNLKLFFTDNELANIIFDITGKSLTSLQNYVGMISDLGYKISLVWVVANREVAIVRNLMRDRVVPQQLFHQIHNQVNDTMFSFLKDPWFSRSVEETWVVFSGPATVEFEKHTNVAARDEVLKNRAFNLIKRDNAFTTFTTIRGKKVDLKTKIIDWLGPQEHHYQNPAIYKSFKQVEMDIASLEKKPTGKIIPGQELDLKQT